MKLKLLEFINSHNNWEELLTSEPYCLKISRDIVGGKNYILFKYDQIKSDFNLPEVREARGIIFNETNWKPVCVPFFKFGNYGESYCPEIDWETASVQEKVDGSLIKIWNDGCWNISTNGTIDAFKANLNNDAKCPYSSFGALFLAAIKSVYKDEHDYFAGLNPNYTYMYELVSPYNQVVVMYPRIKLYFLGLRDNNTLQEYMPELSPQGTMFDTPRRYSLYTLDDVKKAAEALNDMDFPGVDDEGFVVCDAHWNRVKIKSPKYVVAHHIRNNNCITREALMDVILRNEIEEFLLYVPEYTGVINTLKYQQDDIIEKVYDKIKEIKPETFETRKAYAEAVKKEAHWIQPFLFAYDKLDSVFAKMSASKWAEIFDEVFND